LEHWFSTTELSLRFKRSPSNIIKILDDNGVESEDRLVNSHHIRVWDSSCIDVLNDRINDDSVVISDYAAELGVDEKTLRYAMRKTGRYGVLRVVRCKELEDEVKKVVEEEKQNSEGNHPLVTDKRFLQLSFFPDVVPKCFEELDECSSW
jgi:hypothetical protein